MTALTPGAQINGFRILSVDPTGKRCVVGCACRNTHVFSAEALLNGTAMCVAVRPTPKQINAHRTEKAQAQYQRRGGRQDWRPGR